MGMVECGNRELELVGQLKTVTTQSLDDALDNARTLTKASRSTAS